MGNYLNSSKAYYAYQEVFEGKYFVDKSSILTDICERVSSPEKYICITRPRRFGKSVMADMIVSFFSKEANARHLFDQLQIAGYKRYAEFVGQYDVIFIAFNELPRKCDTYEQYIDRIENRLLKDFIRQYPDAEISPDDAVWDALTAVYDTYHNKQFIFVLDEWDFIFHRDFVSRKDKGQYIDFLSNLLKDKPYVALAYMTGILPIAKYSSGSELNMFAEYTMASEELYSDYFGFTEAEVDQLYATYSEHLSCKKVTRDGLRTWYNGYHTKSGEHIYNPRSVLLSFTNNNLGNYWTSSGPYDELYYYINHNIAAVKDDLLQMIGGIPVPAKITEYAATSMELTTRDEIFSAMVVYGFLSYENGCVSIPNKELMDKFRDMFLKETSLGYIHKLAKKSEQMLKATLEGDTETVVKILEYAHHTESPLLSYNDESELTIIVNLVYLQARDFYRIEREDKAGIGYVDFIFYPENKTADCIILELKVNHTAQEALQQIKDRKYALKFEGRLGEESRYTGRILGVGISYDKKTKLHDCMIEVLRDK